MTTTLGRIGGILGASIVLAGVAGCGGGTKMLKDPEQLHIEDSIASEADEHLIATLDWIIVRGGAGSWAKNADWDQYLMRIQNTSAEPLTLESVVVYDSTLTRHEVTANRKQLVKVSRRTAKRYEDADIEVKAGLGAGSLLVAGGLATSVGMGAGAAAVYGGGAVLGATAGALVLAPVLVAGGVVRAANNSKVNAEIKARNSELPNTVSAGESTALSLFFPITPSPQRVEIHYSSAGRTGVLVVDTSTELEGLHIGD